VCVCVCVCVCMSLNICTQAIYVGAILLALVKGRWIDAFMWEGLCFAAAGAALLPHGPEGRRSARFAWGIAAPFLALSFGVRASYVLVRWASRAAIAPDARRHAELWAEARAADPGARAALRQVCYIVLYHIISFYIMLYHIICKKDTPSSGSTPAPAPPCFRSRRP
jgi:hypothetical protein